MPPALPVIRVTGPGRNSGKTTLASGLIERLTARGYRVAAIKRSHHALPGDRPGSDTDRFARAGACSVAFCGPDGTLQRFPAGGGSLEEAVRGLAGEADLAIVEGFSSDTLGARIRLGESEPRSARFETDDGERIIETAAVDVEGLADAIEHRFHMSAAGDDDLRVLIRTAAARHGHSCPGVTLGVRMAVAGLRALGLPAPPPPRRLHVTVEVARCATDAIAAVTGCSPGARDLALHDYGKLAATFLDAETRRAVRVLAREEARAIADRWPSGCDDRGHRQAIAYRSMPDDELLDLQDVREVRAVAPEGSRPPRVACSVCGETVNFGRHVDGTDGPRCIPCSGGDRYYAEVDAGRGADAAPC